MPKQSIQHNIMISILNNLVVETVCLELMVININAAVVLGDNPRGIFIVWTDTPFIRIKI